MRYYKPTFLPLKGNPQHGGEAFIQELIAKDPSVLGLGQLELKQRERIQPGAGRLDLLLEDPKEDRWYEVEVQLGATNESHIIRTIEYWYNERRRYPEIEHVAVIVAEAITNRFFNVISLFNQHIPLIAIKMTALDVEGNQTVIFTRILDLTPKKDEENQDDDVSNKDWKQEYTIPIIKMADEIQELLAEISPGIRLKYNQQYIGTTIDGKSKNFLTLQQRNKCALLRLLLDQNPELDAEIQMDGFQIDYDPLKSKYRLPLREGDVQKHRQFLSELIKRSYSRITDEAPQSESSSAEKLEAETGA